MQVRRETTLFFLRTRGKRIASTKLSPPAHWCTDEQRSHSASAEGGTFLTLSSHTLLLHVYQVSDGPYCVKTGLLIERHSGRKVIAVSQGLNFRSRDSLSALEPSDPGPMHIRKFRILPFFSASVKSKFNIVVVNQVHVEAPTIQVALRKPPSATCSSDSDEGCVFDTDSSFSGRIPERSDCDGGFGGVPSVDVCHTISQHSFSLDFSE